MATWTLFGSLRRGDGSPMAGTPIAVSPPALPWTTSDGTVISKEITTATQANGVFTLNMTSYAGVMWSIQVDGRKTYIVPDPGPGGSIDVKALTPIYQNSSGAVQGGAGVSISGATIENGDTLVFFLSNGYRLPGIKMPSGNAVTSVAGRVGEVSVIASDIVGGDQRWLRSDEADSSLASFIQGMNSQTKRALSRWLAEEGPGALSGIATSISTAQQLAQDALNNADESSRLASQLQAAISTIQGAASNAQLLASQARKDVSSMADAVTQAKSDAASAAGIAGGKSDVIIQPFPPITAYQTSTTLWIDTSNNANQPKRWDGVQWVALTDKVAYEAAATAALAQTRSELAKQTANDAQSKANRKTQTYLSDTSPVAPTGGFTVGDMWIKSADGNRPYVWSGTAWLDVRDKAISDASAAAQNATSRAMEALDVAQQAQATADGTVSTYYQETPPWPDKATGHDNDLGDMWIKSSTGVGARWNGTSWQTISDSQVTAALQAAQNAQSTADGKITAYYQSEQPTNPDVGDIWYDTDDKNRPYYCSKKSPVIWTLISDGRIADAQAKADAAANSAASAITSAQDAKSTADGKAVVYVQSTTPQNMTDADRNDLWLDTSSGNVVKVWTGTRWDTYQDQTIAQALTKATDAQTTASKKITTYYNSTAPSAPSGGFVVGDLWIDSSNSSKVNRWGGTKWVATDIASLAVVSSYGTDLVMNGTGVLGDNTNFSGFTYSTDAPVGLSGSFATADYNMSKTTDRMIPVDPAKQYVISSWMKEMNGVKGSHAYLGYIPLDAQGNTVLPQHYIYRQETNTTLAAPLKKGDTTVQLTSGANWSTAASKNFLNVWNWTDPSGRVWTAGTYTRNVLTILSINNNTLTLSNPYAGVEMPAGTPVSNGCSGGTYVYTTISNQEPTSDWKSYQSRPFGGIWDGSMGLATSGPFPAGTAFVRILFLVNRDVTGTKTAFAGVSMSDALAAQAAADVAKANAATADAKAVNAQNTANRKSQTFYSDVAPTAPSGGFAIGDIWFKTADKNRPYRWSGSAWVDVRDQSIADASANAAKGVSDAASALSAAQQAQAVADGKITTYFQDTPPWADGSSQPVTRTGDIWFRTSSGQTTRWSGTKWQVISDQQIAAALAAAQNAQSTADGKINAFYQPGQPPEASIGDLWYDTDDKNKPYYCSASSPNVVWTPVQDGRIADAQARADAAALTASQAVTSAQNAQSVADGKAVVYFGATAPTGLVGADVNDLWLDSGNGNRVMRWTGSAWSVAQDQSISTALANADAASQAASTAQSTANRKVTTYYSSATPTAPTGGFTTGDMWVDSANKNLLKRWDGSAWISVRDQTIADAQAKADAAALSASQAITNAQTAQSLADGKAVIYVQATTPTGLAAKDKNDLWLDTGNGNVVRAWTGSAWATYQDQSIAKALSDAATAQSAANTAQSTANTKIVTYFQDTQPTTGSVGDLWYNTADKNKPYRCSKAAPSPTWVVIQDGRIADAQNKADAAAVTASQAVSSAQTAQSTADGKAVVYFQSSAPTGMTVNDVNDLWIDSSNGNKVMRWDGSTWLVAQDQGISKALADAATANNLATGAQATANRKSTTYYSDTTPAAPTGGFTVGDMWIKSSDKNRPYRWSGSAWVDVRDAAIADAAASASTAIANAASAMTVAQQAQATADGSVTTYYQDNQPWADNSTQPSTKVGDMWYRSTDNKAFRWNGTVWTPIVDTQVAAALQAAQNAQTTADGKIDAFYQSTAPTAGALGDLWYDTGDKNKPYYCSAVTPKIVWTAISDGRIADAQARADLALSNAGSAITAAQTAQSTADGKAVVYFQSSAPTGLTGSDVNDLWIDTGNGNRVMRWTGSAWATAQDQSISTALTNAAAAQTSADKAQAVADVKITTYYSATAPATPAGGFARGDMWVNSGNKNQLNRWDGSSWVSVRDTTIADAQTTANNAQTAAGTAQSAANAAQTTANKKAVVYVQSAVPTGMTANDINDLWLDTANGNVVKVWTGSAWSTYQDQSIATALTNAKSAQDAAVVAQGTANAKITTYYQAGAPTAGALGDLWFDTGDKNKLYRCTKAAPSPTWTPVQDGRIADAQAKADAAAVTASQAVTSAQTAQSTADGKAVVYFQGTAPTGLAAKDTNDLWLDTSSGNKVFRWSGSAWVTAQDQSISTALANAQTANNLASGAQATADRKTTTYYSDATPAAPTGGFTIGDMWIKSSDKNRPYRWSGSTWVDVRDSAIADAAASASTAITNAATALSVAQQAQATADGTISTYYQASPPWADGSNQLASKLGDMWYRSGDNKAFRWDGSSWVMIVDTQITAAISAAQNAQTTADGKIDAFYQSTQPTTGALGDLWYNTADKNKPYYCSAVSPLTWTAISDGRIADAQARADLAYTNAGTAITSAQTAQSVADGKAVVYVQTTAPTGLTANDINDLWLDTANGNVVKIWSGTAWVAYQDKGITKAISDAAAAATAASGAQTTANRKITTYYGTTTPTAPTGGFTLGDMWVDSANGNQLNRWDGTSWKLIQDAAIPAAQDAAQKAQSAATMAQFSANQKNTIFWNTEPADDAKKPGVAWGDIYNQYVEVDGKRQIVATWLWYNHWQKSELSSTYLPQVDIGTGTFGQLTGDRLFPNTVTATEVNAESIGGVIGEFAKVKANNVLTGEFVADMSLGGTGRIISGTKDGVRSQMDIEGFKTFAMDPTLGVLKQTVQIDSAGFRTMGLDPDGNPQVITQIGSNGLADIKFFSQSDRTIKAAITNEGAASFTDLEVNNDPSFMGRPLFGKRLDPSADDGILDDAGRGLIGFGDFRSLVAGGSIERQEATLGILTIPIEPNRVYSLVMSYSYYIGLITSGKVGSNGVNLYREFGDNPPDPTNSSFVVAIARNNHATPNSVSEVQRLTANFTSPSSTSQTMKLLVTAEAIESKMSFSVTDAQQWLVWVYDMGPRIESTARVAKSLPAQTTQTGGSTTDTTKVIPKKTYTATWMGSESRSFQGSGAQDPWSSPTYRGTLRQGNSQGASGNVRSLVLFNGSSIDGEKKTMSSALSGATISKAEVFVKYVHWWYSNGGMAVLHPYSTQTSMPSTLPDSAISSKKATRSYTAAGQGYWIQVPTDWFSASSRGVVVGPGETTSLSYYGLFAAPSYPTEGDRIKVRLTYTR